MISKLINFSVTKNVLVVLLKWFFFLRNTDFFYFKNPPNYLHNALKCTTISFKFPKDF